MVASAPMRTATLLLMPLALSGCLGGVRERNRQLTAIAAQPIYCQRGDECDVKWGRALRWVRDHSYYKLDKATATIITTQGPFASADRPAFTVTRSALGEGRYQIEV